MRIYCNVKDKNGKQRLLNTRNFCKDKIPEAVLQNVGWHIFCNRPIYTKSMMRIFNQILIWHYWFIGVFEYCLAQGQKHWIKQTNICTSLLSVASRQRSHLWFVAPVEFSSSPHHILFLIGQPCNPVWHKDGCSCWLWANSELNKDESTFGTFNHPLWTFKHTNITYYSQEVTLWQGLYDIIVSTSLCNSFFVYFKMNWDLLPKYMTKQKWHQLGSVSNGF